MTYFFKVGDLVKFKQRKDLPLQGMHLVLIKKIRNQKGRWAYETLVVEEACYMEFDVSFLHRYAKVTTKV
jgi:hypothetical protein